MALNQDIARKQAALKRKHSAVEARLAEMQSELAAETEEVGLTIAQQTLTASELMKARRLQAKEREGTGEQP